MGSLFAIRNCFVGLLRRCARTAIDGCKGQERLSGEGLCKVSIADVQTVLRCRYLHSVCFNHQAFKSSSLFHEHLHTSLKVQVTQACQKTKKASPTTPDEDYDSEDSDEDVEQSSDFKLIKGNINSSRIDAVLKLGLGMSRNKVDNAFYSNNIYLNGERLDKKKHSVAMEDEVDVVRGLNTMNPAFIDVQRLEVLDIQRSRTDPDKLAVRVRRFKRLTIENYALPWKPPASD